jgi:hypothetical protein
MGRAVSVDLDDALPPFEPVAQFPLGPAMPMQPPPPGLALPPSAAPAAGSASQTGAGGSSSSGGGGGSSAAQRAGQASPTPPPLEYFGRGGALPRNAAEGPFPVSPTAPVRAPGTCPLPGPVPRVPTCLLYLPVPSALVKAA